MSTPWAERESLNLQPRHRWTLAEYHRMGEVGLLDEDSRVELIEGELIEMAPIGSPHGGEVKYFNNKFVSLLYGKVIVSVQDPIVLDDYSEPEPDIALLRWRDDFYRKENPHAEDILLIIEVSDSTFHKDRDVKIPLYARSGIPEVWLLDIQQRQLEIYRDPAHGQYQQQDCLRTGQIAPILCPDAVIDLAEVFPKS
ncbi:MAG: Uma2 family endonuclease [Candidatus Contendobacter sp.]